MSTASEVIFQLLFSDFGLRGIGFVTAKLVLPIVSLGHIRVHPLGSTEHSTGRLPDGKIGITSDLAALIGILIWVAVAVAYGVWWVNSAAPR